MHAINYGTKIEKSSKRKMKKVNTSRGIDEDTTRQDALTLSFHRLKVLLAAFLTLFLFLTSPHQNVIPLLSVWFVHRPTTLESTTLRFLTNEHLVAHECRVLASAL